MNNIQKNIWGGLDFFKFKPARINRIKHFALFSFWFTVFIISMMLISFMPFFKITNLVGSLLMSLAGKAANLIELLLMLLVGIVLFAIGIGAFINMLFLKIRRLHDFGLSGWLLLLGFIPIFGFAWVVLIFCVPGTGGKNKFGEQPKAAALPYKILAFLLPILLILFFVVAGYISNVEKFSNWKTYSTKHYSVQFPGNYKISSSKLYNVPYKHIEYLSKEKKVRLNINEINIKYVDPNKLGILIHAMGFNSSLNELLSITPEKFISKVLIDDDEPCNVKVLLDKTLDDQVILGRVIKSKVKFNDGGRLYIKTKIYVDKLHKKYYLVSAYYLHDFSGASDRNIAEHFLSSFKIISR